MISQIIKEKIEEIRPSASELEKIKQDTREVIENIERVIKKKKIKAEVFIGGSLAKGTLIKKSNYDIDIFIRFLDDKNASDILEKVLKQAGIKAERIHGSRDYFRTQGKIMFEIIPVFKTNSAEKARNITDLSYFHVSYINKQIRKNKKLGEQIMLAKYFCYRNECYGAESYIKGFSGYALELLVSYYGSFLNFIKKVSGSKERLVIDPEKFYKNKQDILLNMNEAKLGPIVFVDPTYKQRNALAALSSETFEKFKIICSKFLKSPGKKFFELKKINPKDFNLVIDIYTNRQIGDIAGSKLFKFFRFIDFKLNKSFQVKDKEFVYGGDKKAVCYFSVKSKPLVLRGPPVDKVESLLAFKQAHKNVFIKNNMAWTKEKAMSISEFIKDLRNDKTLKDMNVKVI